MGLFSRRKIIVTHDGRFHADEVFAIALLKMIPEFKNTKLIRSRDQKIIEKADIVLDVGGVYDPLKYRFDHHQTGGAGKHENGIPYSSFGLIWKEFGIKVCESDEVLKGVTEKLVQQIDAMDCGFSITTPIISGVSEFVLDDMADAFNPSWKEDECNRDEAFREVLGIASRILEREIKKAKDKAEAGHIVEKAYIEATDKRIIIFPRHYPFQDVLMKYQEPMFAIYPHTVANTWAVRTISAEKGTFKNRKDLPKAWAGKRDLELAQISGIADAKFCHNTLYIGTACSKEGAVKMAELALKQ
ncbi:MAG: MYG1 family protein [Candidatus Paceibacterota bacterium]|jgi:uncharacterized UPF0160 family protein